MIDVITNWLNAILGWFDVLPTEAWAVIAGIMIGGFVTQWLKRTFPAEILFPMMPKAIQVMWIRITALVLSFFPTFFIWPDKYAIWAALAVGFGTPTVYSTATAVLYRKWPGLEDKMSGTEL